MLSLAVAITLLAGCGTTRTEYVYVTEKIEVPPRPAVPTIQPQALECIPDDAYKALVTRDTLWMEHIKRLEALIRTTH